MRCKTICVIAAGLLSSACLQFATISALCAQETGQSGAVSLDRTVDQPSQQVETPSTPAQDPPPAINISIDPKTGKLVIQSDDPAALDRLEEVMRVNRPPQRPYDVFKVKHARASWVTINLEEYFEENSGNDDSRFRYFFGFDEPKAEEKRELGKRPPLRFIYDNDTNSIVVIGADDSDRETIRELIKLWDVPEPEDDSIDDTRYIELVRIKYSKAESIAASLKETFRDLLSANDKAFQDGDDGESKRDSDGGSGGGFSFAYKGKLSIGVDVVTNSILLSAEGEQLRDIVLGLIKELDDQAKTESEFAVATVPASVNGQSVQEALMRMLAQPKKPEKNKQQQQADQQAQQAQQQQQQNQSRERSSRRSRGR
ncbi:MAG: hypothetical protein Aurels2KO_28540 [Aureliella sp.]